MGTEIYRPGELLAPQVLSADAQQLQDPLQIIVTEKRNLERPFAMSIAKGHLRAEFLAQLVFEVCNVQILCF